jgi:hypothetical protein
MPRRFILEPIYLSAEHDPRFPASLRAVGRMLDATLEGPPPNPELEQLVQRLETSPKMH